MSRKYPYKQFEDAEAWKVLEEALAELVENDDLKELTARRYIVGYLVKKLQEADALAPKVIIANGVHYHPESITGQRD